METKKGRVLMAMSGGVDSSVAAALLLKEGYEVIGITMRLWDEEAEKPEYSRTCCAIDDVNDARRVADKLGIAHYTLNLKDRFKGEVVGDFIEEYSQGRTPNPCVVCNRYLKFDALMVRAEQLGCTHVATGHYARVEKEGELYRLRKGVDFAKDQSYVLYHLNQETLPKVLLPLGGIADKETTRKMAEDLELTVAHKPDSQDICFIPDGDYKEFLLRHAPELKKPGRIVLVDGTVLGHHDGLAFHTVGQRKGLGIAWKEPLYVQELNMERNELIVGPQEGLWSIGLITEDAHFVEENPTVDEPIRVTAKIRYSAKEATATLKLLDTGKMEILFDEPQRAITPGQSVVCYQGEYVVAGGKIREAFSK